MMFRAAIVLLALAVPAFAQHGGGRAGSIGSRGFSSTAGFSSHPAFSQSPGFARPASPARYGSEYRPSPGAGFRAPSLRSPYSGYRYNGTPYNGNRLPAARPSSFRSSYNPAAAGMSRGSNQDRFDARRRQFHNWYVNSYPYWPGYPYLIDPNAWNLGLYDWSDPDDSAYDSSQPGNYDSALAPGNYDPGGYDSGNYESAQNGPASPYLGPYPNQGYAAPAEYAAAAPPLVSQQPLTVIFKSGRAPIRVRNYLMTPRALTDLDSEHYEQIPLDQIDLAATQNFNKVAGVDFQVPAASRN